MSIWFKRSLILLFVSFILNRPAFTQQDTLKADTTHFYRKIESFSNRSKFGKLMHQTFFKPVSAKSPKIVTKKGYKKLIQKPYNTFDGKIIRNINIVTLDPFGFSVTDTSIHSRNFFFNSGNNLHIKSQRITIRNLLLFRKNQPFNSLRVKESERLMRSQNYIHDVFFYVSSSGTKPDSVDILIRELDKWSIIPEGSLSRTAYNITISDNNFLGSGHEFKNSYSKNDSTGIMAFNSTYTIPNIKNTYINTVLHYEIEGNKNFNKYFSIERPFYSALAKWAAGVTFVSQFQSDSLRNLNLVYTPIDLKFVTEDYWAGYSRRILESRSADDQVTNLIFAIRYLRVRYSEKPSEFNDPLHIYSNEDFFLAAIGISTRKYVQDKYIFKYGVIEDVPVGQVFELTGGYQLRNNSRRQYLGTRFSFGNYYQWGYLSTNLEFGTFFNNGRAEQGVLSAGESYFTGLIEINKWKFREFIKPQIILGFNRFSYDSLTINEKYGLDGFNSRSLSGSRRFVATLQTQSYSPWHLLGFRFGPFLIYSIGMLGDSKTGFKNSKVYSQIGLGVLIKNENLIYSSFQISVSFYPIIPGIGQNIFKTNTIKPSDFGFRDFETGKPRKAYYQ